ncbi:hypothetical protein [Kocuria marina]|uniref:hypothetical protein n=1 Tax=Kocuria marina TaxID=223184 RepID=UPI0021A8CE58|nr:hypothetical protein [Kocuria marina]MCT1615768.1 hypothetical protein [Kocuria marina]
MTWHSLSPSIALRSFEDVGCVVTSATDGHGYLGYKRADKKFDESPASSSFVPEQGRTVHVAVPIREADTEIGVRLCVICYVGGQEEPRKFWAAKGQSGVQFDIPESTKSVSVLLRVQGRGALTIAEPVVHYGVELSSWQATLPLIPGQRLHLEVDTVSTLGLHHSALARVQFISEDGEALQPSTDLALSAELGTYFYLDTDCKDQLSTASLDVTPDPQASALCLTGRQWKEKNRTLVLGVPRLRQVESVLHEDILTQTLNWLKFLPSESRLIVLYTTAPPVGHPTLSLRPNRLAEEYRRLGIEVIFFPFSRIADEQRITDSGIVQFSRTEIDQVNELLFQRKGRNNLFICSSFPDIGALTTIDLLKSAGWATMYEVRDEMEEFNRVGYSKWFDPELERQVVNRVDNVVTVSPRLAQKIHTISRGTADPVVVQNAAPPALIRQGKFLRTRHVVNERLRHRIIGYMGHLTDSWFDWDLVISCARENPDFSFEIIGHGMPKNLELPENIEFLGPRTHEEFVEISRRWLVGLIPFQPTPLTYAVDPNKIYEYLAVGLRTVTAPMGSVSFCPSTYIYDQPDDFPRVLRQAVEDAFTDQEIEAINAYILSAGWENRAKTMLMIARLEGQAK